MKIINKAIYTRDKTNEITRKIKTGRRIVIGIITVNCTYALVSFLLSANANDSVAFIKQLLILTSSVVLSYLLYKGVNFAKWLSLLLIIPFAFVVILYLLKLIGILSLLIGRFMLIITIILTIISGIFVGKAESLDMYLLEQRNNRFQFKNGNK